MSLFDDMNTLFSTRWGGLKGAFGVYDATCLPFLETGENAFGKNGSSLALIYNVEADTSFSGYYFKMDNEDLSKYILVFWYYT